MSNILCRLFGHRWGEWHREKSSSRVGVYRIRECERCPAYERYQADAKVRWLLDLTKLSRTLADAMEQMGRAACIPAKVMEKMAEMNIRTDDMARRYLTLEITVTVIDPLPYRVCKWLAVRVIGVAALLLRLSSWLLRAKRVDLQIELGMEK